MCAITVLSMRWGIYRVPISALFALRKTSAYWSVLYVVGMTSVNGGRMLEHLINVCLMLRVCKRILAFLLYL